ncbi:RNA polymerase sigma factor [Agriterribacter sp.]|uniref:RNA polymerase sigma factor n=1 Tax=Agriterribacter sp. TaxID=2821509 RepID=UPI002BC95B3F|nr:sigma-70 family RNA polymerase sigma factor [Agriterribacter sp.]HTN09169.1 sigma-70 family RNA polymerase sigma factor [Agriterribacter sp.]
MLRISNDDAQAFTVLFNLYKDKVYTIAFKLTGSAFKSEEAVQDIFMKLWIKRKELPEVDHFTAWFYTITRNHLFSLIKRKAARENREIIFANKMPSICNNTDEKLLLEETEELLKKALYLLPPQQNKVYRLIKECGMKKEEVAIELKLSTETVKVHLAKAMKNIRNYCLAHMNNPLIWIPLFFF